jgi:hypothetical protein
VLEQYAQPGAPAWSLALAARCRAVLSRGEEREFASALRLHAQSGRWFDRARTALLYGEFLGRERRRTEAREQLRSALDGFEYLSAAPWVERARRELRACGETLPKRDPGAIMRLTAQPMTGRGGRCSAAALPWNMRRWPGTWPGSWYWPSRRSQRVRWRWPEPPLWRYGFYREILSWQPFGQLGARGPG